MTTLAAMVADLPARATLPIRGRTYSGAWPEMDQAAATALWAQLVPYSVSAGGQVAWSPA